MKQRVYRGYFWFMALCGIIIGKKECMGETNRFEKKRPRRTIDAAGLGGRLKSGEPDVGDIWAEQKKIHTSETIKLETTPLIDKKALGGSAKKYANYAKTYTLSAASKVQAAPKKVQIIGVSVASLVLVFGATQLIFTGNNDNGTTGNTDVKGVTQKIDPEFATIAPGGDITNTKSGAFNYDPAKKVASFVDTIGDVQITVSQQQVPDSFKSDEVAALEKLAKDIYANEVVKDANIPAYVGTSIKGPQTTVLVKNSNLIFIQSEKGIELADWANYINTLK
jgi:hypothetical protein